jgi:hypothetical protein
MGPGDCAPRNLFIKNKLFKLTILAIHAFIIEQSRFRKGGAISVDLALAIKNELARFPGFRLVAEDGRMYVIFCHHPGNATVDEMNRRLLILSYFFSERDHIVILFSEDEKGLVGVGRLLFDGVEIWLYPSSSLARRKVKYFSRALLSRTRRLR